MGRLKDLLAEESCLILDGALGTELESRDYDVSGHLWSAKYLLDNPQVLKEIHEDYLQAGADILTTASYQASLPGLLQAGVEEEESLALIRLTVSLAQEAREEVWANLPEQEKSQRPYPLISGDIGPYAAYLADGSEYTGDYHLTQKDYQAFHRPRIAALLEAGCDLLGIETIPNLGEAAAILVLLEQEFPEVEAYMSFVAKDGSHIADGSPIEEVASLCAKSKQVLALGINCSSPVFFDELLQKIKSKTDKPLVAYPNSGEVYDGEKKTWHEGEGGETSLVQYAKNWQVLGAKIIGGCCRTRPSHIEELSRSLAR